MLEYLFAACWVPLAYTYLFYPVLLGCLARLRLSARSGSVAGAGGPPGSEGTGEQPTVSILIAALDEEAVIARKIENCLRLDYNPDRIEIMVASDGSTDRTVERARAAAAKAPAGVRVIVLDFPQRRGKTALLNECVPRTTGEIIAHTDANTLLEGDSLRRVVAPFADPGIGCVVGELVYTNTDEPAVAGGEGLYWRYENFVKEAESALGSTITANGGIYAIRRALFEPVPEHLVTDAVDPLIVIRRGFRVVFERRARAHERAAATLRDEFRRKVRIIRPGLWAWLWARGLLLPPRPLPALEYFSHKLLRWLSPVFLAAAFVINLLLASERPYALLLAGQACFYLVGVCGIFLASRPARPGAPPPPPAARAVLAAGYFLVVNAAAAVGLAQFLVGIRPRTWERSPSTRES